MVKRKIHIGEHGTKADGAGNRIRILSGLSYSCIGEVSDFYDTQGLLSLIS